MARKITIDTQINVAVKSSTEKLDALKTQLQKMSQATIPGVTPDISKQYEDLGEKVRILKNNLDLNIESGTIKQGPVFAKYKKDVEETEISLRNLTNTTLQKIITDKKFQESLKQSTAAIVAQEKKIKEKELALEQTRIKTEAVRRAEESVAKALKIDASVLRDPDQLKGEIAKRQTPSGKPKSIKAGDEIALLNELIKKGKDLEAAHGQILKQHEANIKALEEENIKLEKNKKIRLDIINEGLNKNTDKKTKSGAKKTGGVKNPITEETAQIIKANLKQEESISKVAAATKKLDYNKQSQEISGNVEKNKNMTKALDGNRRSFLQNVTAASLYYGALRILRRVVRAVISTVTDLDKSFTQIAMVTKLSRQEAWKLVDGYRNLGNQVGMTTTEVGKLAVFFARQGRSAEEALEMTKVAAMAAKVASIDATASANFLTSAINGFGLATSEAMAISDKFAALGASSASSYEEMAIALSKVAPVAKTAGVNIDQMMGFLAKGIETTREAPENIGTAFKTVFARMTQLRDFGKTLEEGVAVNTVEEALASAGVALRDSQGTFRDMGDVLTELGGKFDNLGRNQQAYIATALAGTRQQSRLLAVLQDFGRTQELVNISVDSAGATLAQHAEFAGGMEAANARLKNSFEEVITSLVDSEAVVSIINAIAGATRILAVAFENLIPIVILATGFMVTFQRTLVVNSFAKLSRQLVMVRGRFRQLKTTLTTLNVAKIKTMIMNSKLVLSYQAINTATLKTIILSKSLYVALGLSLGVIALVAGAFYLLRAGLKDTGKAAAKTTEAINQLSVDLFNLNKETTDFNELIDSFNQLDKTIFKTTDDLKEMDTLMAKIREYGGSQYDFVLAGRLDMKAVEAFNLTQEATRMEKLGELRQQGDVAMQRIIDFDDPEGEASFAERRAAIEFMASNFKNYDKMEKEEQERIKLMLSNNFNFYVKEFEKNSDAIRLNSPVNPFDHFLRGELSLDRFRGTEFGKILFGEFSFAKDFININLSEISKSALDAMEAFDKAIGTQDASDISSFMNKYFQLSDKDQQDVKSVFGQSLLAVLNFGEDLINDFVSQGYNMDQIVSIGSSVEVSMRGLEVDGVSKAADVAKFYATAMSKVNAGDIEGANNALSQTINFIKELGLNSEDTSKFTSRLVDTLTDPTAFQSFLNAIKQSSNSIKTLMDASKAFSEGTIPENFESLISSYPQLENDIRNGTLTIEKVVEATTKNLSDTLTRKLLDLNQQLLNAKTDEESAIVQAQIDAAKAIVEDPTFLLGQLMEEQVRVIEDRYKTEIDFIKNLNSEKQKEIDLTEKQIGMTKSMLDLDRQIAALSRDTSFGAQARLRNLQEQQRTQAIEREKFVMDLITDQAVAKLEKDSQHAILDIKTILKAMAVGLNIKIPDVLADTAGVYTD